MGSAYRKAGRQTWTIKWRETTGEIRYSREDCDRYDPTIYGFTIGGIALFAVGIPLFVVGARRVPVKEPPKASVSPWVSPTGGGATLRLEL